MVMSSLFIKRPIGTVLLIIGVIFSGIIAFNSLPVASLPQIEFPTISIQTALPGASPEIMASTVATPLEHYVGTIAGITQMTSTSTQGAVQLNVQFDLSRRIDAAARDVQAAINAAQTQLPDNLLTMPTYRKVNPADAPILILGMTSDSYTSGQLYDLGSTLIAQNLSRLDGVGRVLLGGGSMPALRIELNPYLLNQYGLSIDYVRTMLAQNNIFMPKGQLVSNNTSFELATNDQLFSVEDYESLVIYKNNHNCIRLKDIASIKNSVEDEKTVGLINGKPGITLIIFKEPGANVINTAKQIKKTLLDLNKIIPSDIDLKMMIDRTTTIQASLVDIEFTLVFSIVLVVAVIYLFFKHLASTLIPAITIPLSLCGTLCVMYLMGFSLNNLSLMALTIATGFIIDDAVVVVENIIRHLERHESPVQAALKGSQEVGFTIFCISLSLVAVFVPILLMPGIVGRLINEFAVTLVVAILTSMLISLTITPMLCAFFLKNINVVAVDKNNLYLFYEKSLLWVINHPNLMVLLTIIVIVLNVFLFKIIPKGIFPTQDTGRITGLIQGRQNIPFHEMKNLLKNYVDIILSDDGVDSVVAFAGGGTRTLNQGNLYIGLKPLSERKISSETIINRLRKELKAVGDGHLYLQSAQDLSIGSRVGAAQYQYTLRAFDLNTLQSAESSLFNKLGKIPGVLDLNTDQLKNGTQIYTAIDRDRAATLGVNVATIDRALYDAFGQRKVSTNYYKNNQYNVVMEVDPAFSADEDMMNYLYVKSMFGSLVPLSLCTDNNIQSTLLAVNHQGQFPAATFSFNLAKGYSLSNVTGAFNEAFNSLSFEPGSLSANFQGTAQAFEDLAKKEGYLFFAALVTVYFILGMLYENLIHPLTILSTLPSAGVGALLALIFTRSELNIMALMGLILLIGIVQKNAIMIIDVALHLQRFDGKDPKEAIYEACLLRIRPILMTSMATLLSAIPLALGEGMGSELRQPLGISIIGGLVLSQVITLYTTPAIYLFFDSLSKKRRAH